MPVTAWYGVQGEANLFPIGERVQKLCAEVRFCLGAAAVHGCGSWLVGRAWGVAAVVAVPPLGDDSAAPGGGAGPADLPGAELCVDRVKLPLSTPVRAIAFASIACAIGSQHRPGACALHLAAPPNLMRQYRISYVCRTIPSQRFLCLGPRGAGVLAPLSPLSVRSLPVPVCHIFPRSARRISLECSAVAFARVMPARLGHWLPRNKPASLLDTPHPLKAETQHCAAARQNMRFDTIVSHTPGMSTSLSSTQDHNTQPTKLQKPLQVGM